MTMVHCTRSMMTPNRTQMTCRAHFVKSWCMTVDLLNGNIGKWGMVDVWAYHVTRTFQPFVTFLRDLNIDPNLWVERPTGTNVLLDLLLVVCREDSLSYSPVNGAVIFAYRIVALVWFRFFLKFNLVVDSMLVPFSFMRVFLSRQRIWKRPAI